MCNANILAANVEEQRQVRRVSGIEKNVLVDVGEMMQRDRATKKGNIGKAEEQLLDLQVSVWDRLQRSLAN